MSSKGQLRWSAAVALEHMVPLQPVESEPIEEEFATQEGTSHVRT